MRRRIAIFAVAVGLAATASPTGASAPFDSHLTFRALGEARALEVAIGGQGISLGVASAHADSSPSAGGVGAGQCALLGSEIDPEDLPCNEATVAKSQFPGNPGNETPRCAGSIPNALASVVDLKVACGGSRSGLSDGRPFTTSSGKVAHAGVRLPVGAVLDSLPLKPLVGDLSASLGPLLNVEPRVVQDAVEEVVDVVTDVRETEVVALDVGHSTSSVSSEDGAIAVRSTAHGAVVGVLGIPEVDLDGNALSGTSDPLRNGLVIVEVGTSRASASVDGRTVSATGAASAALVTVKVRDITKPEPTYVELSVAPGQTVTVLEGTPAESTIVAADSTINETGRSAAATANAVRLHLLKGVNGGVTLALARATAAITGRETGRPGGGEETTSQVPRPRSALQPLPVTGGTDHTIPAVTLLVGAALLLLIRRRATRLDEPGNESLHRTR